MDTCVQGRAIDLELWVVVRHGHMGTELSLANGTWSSVQHGYLLMVLLMH
jgi:hypothetical protein